MIDKEVMDRRVERAGGGIPADAIAGKMIAGAYLDYRSVAIRFADGSWLYGEAEEDGYEGAGIDWDAPPEEDALHLAGVISTEELAAIRRDREEARGRARRAEYERLRAEFEGGGVAS